jgi:hypothetical protein
MAIVAAFWAWLRQILASHPVCETCETGIRVALDDVLDTLIEADEIFGVDVETVLRLVRTQVYNLRSEYFDYQGVYIPKSGGGAR